MPNTTVPADATPLPAVHSVYAFLTADLGIHLPGLMRRAVNRARHEYQHGKAYGLTWGKAMSDALRSVWAEAKGMQASLKARQQPAPAVSELDRAQLALLSIQCAERPTRRDHADMNALHARIVELRASL